MVRAVGVLCTGRLQLQGDTDHWLRLEHLRLGTMLDGIDLNSQSTDQSIFRVMSRSFNLLSIFTVMFSRQCVMKAGDHCKIESDRFTRER